MKIILRRQFSIALFIGLISLQTTAYANTTACFKTNISDFCIALFETQAPKTVANFLNYINSGAYTNGIFHRSVPGFVIQGGGFKITSNDAGNTLTAIDTFAPIANEFNISNTRGTVAMAKIANNPDSATSEWFVNLADNSANLDKQNSGFTVFGRVIFDGMDAIDAMENLPVVNLGASLTQTPVIDYDGQQVLIKNLVQVNTVKVINTTAVFSDGFLNFAVDIGTNDFFEVTLRLIADSPQIIFELDPASIAQLQTMPANSATFSSQAGTLNIPSVLLNASAAVNNVVMALTDANTFQFTLLSYEQAD